MTQPDRFHRRSSGGGRTPAPRPIPATREVTVSKRADPAALVRGGLAPPASSPAAGVLALQRVAGNDAVAAALQRDDTKTAVLDPEVVAVGDKLQLFCDKGGDVAWDLYRALLQLQSDAANDKHGRMTTDSQISEEVTRAQTSHKQALQFFHSLRKEGADHLAAAQSEAAKDVPDDLAVKNHVLELMQRAETAASQLTSIAERAWEVAVQAEEKGHLVAARHAFRAADSAEEVAGEPRPRVWLHRGSAPIDKLGLVYGRGVDAGGNTVGGGTYGNAVSIAGVAGGQGSTAAAFATGTGAVFAPLGTLCSSIALGLAVTGAVKSGRRKEQLELLQQQLANPRAREAAAYAIEQKTRKRTHRWVSAGAAVVGLAAGIAGCVALGVPTFGVGALVIGLIGAVAGIGLLVYKIYRSSKRARKGKMKEFAKSLIKVATDASADPADRDLARERIRALGQAPADEDFTKTSVDGLASSLAAHAESQRAAVAEGLLDLCVNGRRSEQRDAKLVLEGLKLDPDQLRDLAENDKGEEAIEKVKSKLASW